MFIICLLIIRNMVLVFYFYFYFYFDIFTFFMPLFYLKNIKKYFICASLILELSICMVMWRFSQINNKI